MEYFKEKYRKGVIDFKTYEKMLEIVAHIEQNGYEFVGKIGDGSYGSVLKVKHLESGKHFAAKVVEKKYASDGEINIWKTLHHENILKVTDIQFAYYADSYVFFTPLYAKTLDQKLFESTFLSDKKALKQALSWLKQILNGVVEIHDKGLSHNDIKPNNILISDTDTAVVADFGFLTHAENDIHTYGTPFIYRCPEARLTESGMTPIDGKKLDTWTMGMLAFEMFTKMALLTEMSKPNVRLSCWFTDVYPVLQKSLQRENFIKLMKEAFPKSAKVHEVADDIISFITSCLNIVPGIRPDIRQLQKHKLVGGSSKNLKPKNYVNIWKKELTVREFNAILQQNNLEIITESLTEESCSSQYSENIIKYNSMKTSNATDPNINQPCIFEENALKHQYEHRSGDIHKNSLLHFDGTNNQILTKRDASSNFDVTPPPAEINQCLSAVSSHKCSLNTPDLQTTENLEYDFEFDISESNEIPIPPASFIVPLHVRNLEKSSEKITRALRIRKWWRSKKNAVSRAFAACFSCMKKE